MRATTTRNEPIVQTRTRPKGEKRRTNWSLWVFVAIVLVVLLVAPFFFLRPRADTYTLRSYETSTVKQGTLVDYVRVTGSVVPKLERSILAPVEGILAEWLVAEGDEVIEGATLGRLGSQSLGQEIADAEKEVKSAQLALDKLAVESNASARALVLAQERLQTSLTQAEAEFATVQKLFDAGAVSKNELDTAYLKVEQAKEDVENKAFDQQDTVMTNDLANQEAQLRLEQAQTKLANLQVQEAGLELTAPVAGRVMKLSVAVGQVISAQALLATVASGQDLRVVVTVPEVQAGRVGIGQIAKLRVGTTDYEGSVVQVSPNAESSQSGPIVPVTLGFDTPPQNIRIGASASADIEADRKEDALYLPRGAYLSTGGERFVYLVNGDTAVRTNIIFGIADGNTIEVEEGLKAGDKIVSSSYEAFKDRAEIELVAEGEIK